MQIPNIPTPQDSWRRGMRMPFALLAALAVLGLIAFLALSATGQTQAQNPPGSAQDFALTWSSPSDGSIAGYLYSTDNGLNWTQVQGTGGVIEGPAPGESTVVLIRDIAAPGGVVLGAQQTTPTPATAAQVRANTVPDLTAREAGGIVTLTWTEAFPPPGSGATVALYEIDWSADGSDGSWQLLARIGAGEARLHNDRNLQPGRTRHYRVRAQHSGGGYGQWSGPVSVTPEIERPNTPVLTAGTPEPGTIHVTWTEAPGARAGSEIHGYELQSSRTGQTGSWETLVYTGSDEREYYDWGLDPGQTHHYRVRSEDDQGTWSGWSATVSAVVLSWPPYDPYLSVYAAGTNGIQAEWESYAQDENSPVTSHEIQVSSDGGNNWQTLRANLPARTTTYYHAGLAAGTERHYRVRSCNSSGCSEWSEGQATSGEYPVPAQPVAAARSTSPPVIEVSWTQPDGGGSAITGYQMECSEDGIYWYYPSQCGGYAGPGERSMTHDGLLENMEVYYRVQAENANGYGAWSEPVRASTPRGVPAAIEDLSITEETDHTITMTWSEPRGGPIAGYVVERTEINWESEEEWSEAASLPGSSLSYTDTGLYSGSTYMYRVSASNEVGRGPAEGYGAIGNTTGESQYEPGEVENVRITSISASGVTFAWDPPSDDGGRPVTRYDHAVGYDFSVPVDDSQTAACEDGSQVEGSVPGSSSQATIPAKQCVTESGNTAWLEMYLTVEAANAIGSGWSMNMTSAWLPNRGGTLNVGASNITLAEGTSTSYTVRLSKAPTKNVRIEFRADGDPAVAEQVNGLWMSNDDWNVLTPDNWQQGVTITLNAPEDGDLDSHTGVIHHQVVTDLRHLPGLEDGHATEQYDPAFHHVSGTSVKVTFTDTGSNVGGGAGS